MSRPIATPAAATLDAPPPLVPVSRTLSLVFMASLRELVRRRRLVFLGLVASIPLMLTIVWRLYGTDHMSATRFFSNLGGLVYLKALVYLVGLVFGVPTVHDEVEGRTITYLFTRPISRIAVYAGRLLAVQVVGGGLLAASLGLCFLLMIMGNFGAVTVEFVKIYTNYVLVVLLAAICYTAVFALIGTAFKKPLVWGFLYAFGWESAVSVWPTRIQTWTFEFHLRNLVTSREDVQKTLFDWVRELLAVSINVPSWVSLLVLIAAMIALMVLGGTIFSRKEYVIN